MRRAAALRVLEYSVVAERRAPRPLLGVPGPALLALHELVAGRPGLREPVGVGVGAGQECFVLVERRGGVAELLVAARDIEQQVRIGVACVGLIEERERARKLAGFVARAGLFAEVERSWRGFRRGRGRLFGGCRECDEQRRREAHGRRESESLIEHVIRARPVENLGCSPSPIPPPWVRLGLTRLTSPTVEERTDRHLVRSCKRTRWI